MTIPYEIPDAAREVFIVVAAYQSDATIGSVLADFLKVCIQQDNTCYEQYLNPYLYLSKRANKQGSATS